MSAMARGIERYGAWVVESRWIIAAVVLVGLVGLTQVSLVETTRQPLLGVRAARIGDQLVVNWVLPAGWAWDAGVRPGDIVVAVADRPVAPDIDEGDVTIAPSLEVRSVSRATTRVAVASAVETSAQYRRSFLVLALCFVIVGSALFVLVDDLLVASIVLACTTAWATALIAAVAAPFGRVWALGLVYLAVLAFGTTTLLLFLVFPLNHLLTRVGRWAAATSVGGTVVLVAAYGWVVTVQSAAYAILQPAAFALVVVEFLGASVLVVRAFKSMLWQRREVRRVLVLVALSTLASLLPFCLLALGPRLLGISSLVPPDIAILSAVFLPLGLSAAALSRQFLGITRLVRRGLVALIVWIGLLGAYSLGFIALWQRVAPPGNQIVIAPGALVLGLALVLGTFPLLQQRLRRLLEHALFHDIYDYAATLHQLSTDIVQLNGADAIAGHFLARLGHTLDLSWAAIALHAEGLPGQLYRWGDCPNDLERLLAQNVLPAPGFMRGSTDGNACTSLLPLTIEGMPYGTLATGPKRQDLALLPEDLALLATLVPVVTKAFQNARLIGRLEAQVAILGERERELAALSVKLMQVQEEERRRLALDLHDDPLQRAALLVRDLRDAPDHRVTLHDLRALEDIIGSLQAICTSLRPPSLDNVGLVGGLERLVHDLRARADLNVTLDVAIDHQHYARLPDDLETALYRVAQEALNNCLKHARASRVAVTYWREGPQLGLRIVDNGRGYDATVAADGKLHSLQLGILGMRERLRPWGGQVHVAPGASGGTVVLAELLIGGDDDRT